MSNQSKSNSQPKDSQLQPGDWEKSRLFTKIAQAHLAPGMSLLKLQEILAQAFAKHKVEFQGMMI